MADILTYLQQLLAQETPSSSQPKRTMDIPLSVPYRDRMPSAWSPQLERQIETIAKMYDIDPEIADRLVRAESSYNAKALGTKGERGLTQLMPATAVEMDVTDPTDPEQSLHGGFGYLQKLMKRYKGDTKKALTAYNWGMGNLDRAILTPPAKKSKGQQNAEAYADKIRGKR